MHYWCVSLVFSCAMEAYSLKILYTNGCAPFSCVNLHHITQIADMSCIKYVANNMGIEIIELLPLDASKYVFKRLCSLPETVTYSDLLCRRGKSFSAEKDELEKCK